MLNLICFLIRQCYHLNLVIIFYHRLVILRNCINLRLIISQEHQFYEMFLSYLICVIISFLVIIFYLINQSQLILFIKIYYYFIYYLIFYYQIFYCLIGLMLRLVNKLQHLLFFYLGNCNRIILLFLNLMKFIVILIYFRMIIFDQVEIVYNLHTYLNFIFMLLIFIRVF